MTDICLKYILNVWWYNLFFIYKFLRVWEMWGYVDEIVRYYMNKLVSIIISCSVFGFFF